MPRLELYAWKDFKIIWNNWLAYQDDTCCKRIKPLSYAWKNFKIIWQIRCPEKITPLPKRSWQFVQSQRPGMFSLSENPSKSSISTDVLLDAIVNLIGVNSRALKSVVLPCLYTQVINRYARYER